MERIALEPRPRMLIGGFSAYSRHKDWARMRAIADKVGAVFWVDMGHVHPEHGAHLVGNGAHAGPVLVARVGREAADEHAGPGLQGDALHLVVVDQARGGVPALGGIGGAA